MGKEMEPRYSQAHVPVQADRAKDLF